MPIDERLREALRPHAPTPHDDLLEAIVQSATRRRRVRAATVGLAAAVATLLIAVGVQKATSESRTDGQPVDTPTSGLPTPSNPETSWTFHAADSPLDGRTWLGPALSRTERLAALDGTALEKFGDAVYSQALEGRATSVTFRNHVVEVRTWDTSQTRPQTLYPGTFTVRGKTVLIELDDAHGTTTFRWDRVPDGAGERLELTFTDTTVKSLHSAPAEVFLRMWSVAPFWEPQPDENAG